MEERYNKIIDISFKFGVRIIELFQYLVDKKVNFAIPNQILRSGTSIGANVNESVFAQSKKDFINKMHIALKEANETKYWLRLLYESGYINDKQFESMTDDLKNIVLQQYHPRVRIQLWSLDQQEFEEQNPDSDEVALHGPVNIKILNDDLEFFLTHKSINQAEEYKKYVSKPDNEGVNQGTFKNILFTDSDDINTIIPFEYHKGVFYLRLPRWMRYIDMHICISMSMYP